MEFIRFQLKSPLRLLFLSFCFVTLLHCTSICPPVVSLYLQVRQLKADPNLPQDTASQLALVSEIYELKRLKALLPCEAPCKEDTHTVKRRKT